MTFSERSLAPGLTRAAHLASNALADAALTRALGPLAPLTTS